MLGEQLGIVCKVTLTIHLYYLTHGVFIFNIQLMHPRAYVYNPAQHLYQHLPLLKFKLGKAVLLEVSTLLLIPFNTLWHVNWDSLEQDLYINQQKI